LVAKDNKKGNESEKKARSASFDSLLPQKMDPVLKQFMDLLEKKQTQFLEESERMFNIRQQQMLDDLLKDIKVCM